jgi:hypothetical protein
LRGVFLSVIPYGVTCSRERGYPVHVLTHIGNGRSMSVLFDPQFTVLSFEIWFLILMVGGLTTYGVAIVTEIPTAVLWTLLNFGAYAGNVVARALEFVPATNIISPDVVINSSYACFAGMLAVMAIWFFCKLVLPGLIKPKTVRRPNAPRAVVGSSS